MAITFQKESRAKEYVALVFFIIIAIAAIFFLWKIFFSEATSDNVSLEEFRKPYPKINAEVLLNPKINDLRLFQDVQSFDGAIGKDNPFTPAN